MTVRQPEPIERAPSPGFRRWSNGVTKKAHHPDKRGPVGVVHAVTPDPEEAEKLARHRLRMAKKKKGIGAPLSPNDVRILQGGIKAARVIQESTPVTDDEDEYDDLSPSRPDRTEDIPEAEDVPEAPPAPPPPSPKRKTLGPFEDGQTPPMTLWKLMGGQFGMAWVRWEPETLWSEIEKEFGVMTHPTNQEKLLALQLLLEQNSFWSDWQMFEKVSVTLAGRTADFDESQILSLDEVHAAMSIARALRSDEEYDELILHYVAALAHYGGMVYLQPPLDLAQEQLDVLTRRPPLVDEVVKALKDGVSETTPEGIQVVRLNAIAEASGKFSGIE